ncbi:kinesin-related protein 13-like isoform X1 [Bradysia coprophila]|uniref:kinesin-related protein 13-like isoform X1 n=1 Tax=Bradysia coprophila TaxID=38358 RepID=UPI00187D714F|nr:kinesin-related protein 13-like isoform X1 [Bradysia coprophila]
MSNIKVCVKIRPLSERDVKLKKEEQWKVADNNSLQCMNIAHPCKFTFDHVFGTKSPNYEMYLSIVKPIFESCLIGFNGAIITYGSSSAGKNYTMLGTNMDPGILLATIEQLFIKIGGSPHHTIRFGYIEIYKEQICDLLNDRKPVWIDQNKKFDFMLSNDEIVVENFEKAAEIAFNGSFKRKSAKDDGSKLSSLSHSIFRITIESEDKTNGNVQISCLRFVHVAGGELMTEVPLSDTMESVSNKSLYWFNVVIEGLNKGEKNINFNNSVLTALLREPLTGKSNTAIICSIRPDDVEETISTLRFIIQAKNIRTLPMRNEMYNVRTSFSPASANEANYSQLIHLDNPLKQIANLKVENLLLRHDLEEERAAAAVRKKWFGEQMKSAEFAYLKLEHALSEQQRIQSGLELKIEHLTDSNEQLLAKLDELNNGTSVYTHKPSESVVLRKNGTSNLMRESAKSVDKHHLHNEIATGTKRKNRESSESDWSETSKTQKCELNCDKADVDPSPSTGYTRVRNRDKSETCTITVRNALVGRLMGRGGSIVNNIRNVTGASIKFSERNGEPVRNVTVNGNSCAVTKAVDMIKERLELDN